MITRYSLKYLIFHTCHAPQTSNYSLGYTVFSVSRIALSWYSLRRIDRVYYFVYFTYITILKITITEGY